MRAALWGPDHTELGMVASEAVGPRAAIALSRGRHPKTYGYTDPNEDVAAAVAGPRATLLVCADGHNGSTAPVRAVQAVLEELGDDPPPGLDRKEWPRLFGRVNEAVLQTTSAGSRQPHSRTVLVVALVAGDAVSWGAMGDAALVACRPGPGRGRQLNREAMRFVGHPMSSRALADAVARGEERLGPGEWLIAVTDGLSEFVNPLRPADVLPRILALAGQADGSPVSAARAVVQTAGEAGAGDNVGVALLAPSTEAPA